LAIRTKGIRKQLGAGFRDIDRGPRRYRTASDSERIKDSTYASGVEPPFSVAALPLIEIAQLH